MIITSNIHLLLQKTILLLLLAGVSIVGLYGQNIADIGKEKPLKVNGGLSFNQLFYDAPGMQSGRMPYTYFLAGNINFSIYGWSVPLSYTYSNQQSSFQQPFNQYSMHPSYKWITAHIGYASMTFSPYTLSGHQFLGAGVELTPGSMFKFSAMCGRLQKAVQYDTTSTYSQPAYQRIGFGLKAGMTLDKNTLDLIFFRSKDDNNSLTHPVDSLLIYPEENVALGTSVGIALIPNVSLQVEYGVSFITRDTRSDEISQNIFYTKRTSSEKYNAVKSSVKYSQSFYSIGVSYERIDPGYRTHGAYYFSNDLENIATNLSLSLFQKKVNVGANVGVQHDDLNNQKASNMLRVVNSYNLGVVPTNKLNITATYSNFRSHTNIKSQFQTINQVNSFENLDTLNFTQISENTSLNTNYTLPGNENHRQSLNFNGTFQKASEYQAQVLTNSGAKFMSANIAHSYTWVKVNTSLSSSVNYSNSRSASLKTYTIGPTASVRRSFLKNTVKTSLSASYNNSYANGKILSSIYSFRTGVGYTWVKKHNLNFTGAWMNRTTMSVAEKKTNAEFTATFSYTYNF